MWSLAVEATFYLCLPLLMLAVIGRSASLRPGRVAGLVLVLTAISVWWHLDGAEWAGPFTPGSPEQWLPAYTSWFAVGIGLALVHVLYATGRLSPSAAPLVALARQPGVCWTIVGGLILVAATPIAGPSMLAAPTSGQSLTKNLLYAAIGGLVVLTGVFNLEQSRYTRVFAHGSGRRLGWISYGVFSLHLAVLHFVMWSTGWELFRGRFLLIWLLTVLMTVALAEVVYRLVERPALRLKTVRFNRGPSRRDGSGPGGITADRSTAASGTSTA